LTRIGEPVSGECLIDSLGGPLTCRDAAISGECLIDFVEGDAR
jgi:hypothetical protein